MDTEENGNSVALNEWGSNTLPYGSGLIPSPWKIKVKYKLIFTQQWYGITY